MARFLEQLSSTSISRAFLDVAHRQPDKPALLTWQDGHWEGYTYAALAHAVEGAASALGRLGVKPGDRVALLGQNSPQWGAAYLSILHAGAVAVPLDRLQTPVEWTELLRASQATAVIAAAREGISLQTELAHARSVRHFIWLDHAPGSGDLTFDQIAAHAHDDAAAPRKSPDDLAAIIFTSGTTGKSKGVMLTHRNILYDAAAMLDIVDLRSDDGFLSVLPLSHCYECTCGFLAPLFGGARVCYARAMASSEIIEDLRTSKATFLLGVPLLYEKIVSGVVRGLSKDKSFKARAASTLWAVACIGRPLWKERFGKAALRGLRDKIGLSNIHYLISGGAPLPASVGNALEALGVKFLQGYGLTETAPVATLNPVKGAVPSSVGKPLEGVQVRINGPDAEGKGEIWIRGPIVTSGYWHDPKATSAAFEQGWFKTGDLGRFDSRGHLYITGRSKHLIITPGGKNISPEEVELAALRSPFIAEIIVHGAPAKDGTGEDVHALVYPDHDYLREWAKSTGEGPNLNQILRNEIDRTTCYLASYKRIKHFEISAEPFAKTTTQKIKRHVHTARHGEAKRVRV
jgi:long-chain acyl-CoA synthetase